MVPVGAGDAIRVEVRSAPGDGLVNVESTRPIVLFGFLERFLQREGFGTKFLFDSPSGEDMLYELSEGGCPSPFGAPEADADMDTDTDAETESEMSLLEIARADVERWVNVCFGGGRDGEDWEPVEPSSRILLRDALNHFGHPAVTIYLLGTHYSMPLGDAFEGLVNGSKNAGRISEVLKTLEPEQPSPPDMHHYVESFREALADDLDTPLALVIVFEWVLEAERRGGNVGDNDLRVMLEVLELDDLAAPAGA